MIPEKWREHAREEALNCEGCKNESIYEGCQKSSIRTCAKMKKVEFCIYCGEYPCNLFSILNQKTHFQVSKENPKRIRQVGLNKWLAAENKRWECTKCGIQFSWYEERCAKCGTKLFNAVEEAKMKKKT